MKYNREVVRPLQKSFCKTPTGKLTVAHSLILFILLSIFSSGGCAFLGLSDESSEDPYSEDFDSEEDGDDEEEEDEEGDEEDYEDEEEDMEGEEDYTDEDEEEEDEGGGFFDWLFGSSDDEEEDEEDGMGEFGEDGMGDETGDGMGPDGMDYDPSSDSDNLYPNDTSYTGDGTFGGEGTNIGEDSSSPSPSLPQLKKNIPLQKIKTSSYRKGNILVNAVYIARQGDTLRNISSKIYGGVDRTADLHKVNPHLKHRDLKVGDKIYYNSPIRPNDNSKLLFYYRDINAESSFHSLSQGSNIRTESTKLLGHPNSWKEIWATNPDLISKGDIEQNLNIVYWPQGATAQVATAPSSDSPADSFPEDSAPEEEKAPDFPSDAHPEEAMGSEDSASFPPPPPPAEVKSGIEDKSFPPPPPPMPPSENPKKDAQSFVQSLFKQKGIIFGLISVVIILILMIRLVLKKRKQRDFDYTATNIEV